MPPSVRRIAVTGATGYIGGRLVPRLLEAGYMVRCIARSPEKLSSRPWVNHPLLEIRHADLADPAASSHALEGCHAAYYLVHSMTSAGSHYARVDSELATVFGQASRAAGLRRIVYLGGLGETGANLSQHLSSRREVEAALSSGGVPVTVLRAAMIIGSGSASFEILRYLVERLPVMVTPKWVNTPCQPVAIRNVLHYLLHVLDVAETTGGTFDIGGPEVLPYRDIMRVMAEELGLRRRWIIPVPVLTPRLSSYWIHLITPLSHEIGKPLAEGLKNPVVCRDRRIQELIPQDLLPIREAIRVSLSRVASHDVETSWSTAGPIPGDPDWAGGAVFRDERELPVAVEDHEAFRAICRVGGDHGWYAANWLWHLRGWIDRLAGGPGLRRGRRDPDVVGYGEALDFWRVVGFERNRRLRLRAEMKLPGEAVLEFTVIPQSPSGCLIRQLALFQPRGLFGILYWYAVAPFHHVVFQGMLQGIARESRRSAELKRNQA